MNNKPLLLGLAKVTFHHDFQPENTFDKKNQISKVVRTPKATTVTIETAEEKATAKAICSNKDHFNYEIGRKLAMKKAFAKMKYFTKEERAKVWQEYNLLKKDGRW